MRIDIIPQLGSITDNDICGKTVIVIDLLRATSSITTALANEANCVIPVETPNEAEDLANLLEQSVLAGEREGVKIKGFSLGNSPLEFTHKRVSGKTVIHCTTNGTRTILLSQNADNVLIGSMLNRSACANYAVTLGKDITIICAGRKNGPASEDSICAGALVDYLRTNHYQCNFSNLAMECYYLYKTLGPSIHNAIYKSPSGQNLINMGLKVDIDFCLRKDVFSIVPVFEKGKIIPTFL